MITATFKKTSGFTRTELMVVVAILLSLVILFALPELEHARVKASRISCVSNLNCVGLAYHIWVGDNHDQFPAESTNGWLHLATNANQGINCWTNFVVMAATLGQSPGILVCPADERKAARALSTNRNTDFCNRNLSYFVGIGANDSPESILGGDRNLGPGPKPGNDYGLSPANGLGNDVVLSTNSITNPLFWSLKMHSAGGPGGAGNLLMGDGSVQQCSSGRFQQDYQPHAGNIVPSNTTFRLIFP